MKKSEKKTFIMFSDVINYIDGLSDHQIAQLYKATLCYANNLPIEIDDPEVKGIWRIIKHNMDQNNAAYEEKCEQMRQNRMKREQKPTNVDKCNQIETDSDNENDNDISKEISSNEDTKKAPAEPPAPKKTKFGTYKHVMMTEKEHAQLIADYGASNATAAIEYMDEYIERKGYKTKSHYLAIRKWVFDAMKEDQIKAEELKQREERLNNKSSPAYEAKQRRSDAKRGMERDVNYDAKMVDELIRSIK